MARNKIVHTATNRTNAIQWS